MVKFTCSALAAQGFTGSDPGHRPSHRSSGHTEAASHKAQPEALTTRIYYYVLGGFVEKKKEKRKKERGRLATDVSSGPIFNKKVCPQDCHHPQTVNGGWQCD